jgi:hypothetical protein
VGPGAGSSRWGGGCGGPINNVDMSTNLTEQEFSKHLGGDFKVILSDGELTLTLTEAKAYMPQENEQPGMERFSVFFKGPPELMLPQRTYSMRHEKMGDFDIFMTPLNRNEKTIQYEAVFNYYRKQ